MQRYFLSHTTSSFLYTSSLNKPINRISRFRNVTSSPLISTKKSCVHTGTHFSSTKKNLSTKAMYSVAAVSMVTSYYCYASSSDDQYATDNASASMSAFSISTSASTVNQLLNSNSRAAMQVKSTQELMLGLFVYKLCSFPWIVEAAPHIIKLAESLHIQTPMYWFVKSTFFSQFCGGETAEECATTMSRMSLSGINCILDLSVEGDMHTREVSPNENHSKYWQQEQKADVNLEMIKKCLKTAAMGQQFSTNTAFAAIKMTAFAPPELLVRLNQVMLYLDQAFETYQVDGVVDTTCVNYVVSQICPASQSEEQEQQRTRILSLINKKGTLDYTEFTKLFNLGRLGRDIWWESDSSKTGKDVFLIVDDIQAYDRMIDRLEQVCRLAQDLNVGVMIDAEQSYFQEVIDHVALNLQEKYNRRDNNSSPTVYNTYQMYTKAAQKKLKRDVERAERNSFTFAAKLVRGAYMVSERKRAEQMNYPSPIHDTLEETHASYNNSVRFLIQRLHQHQSTTGQALASTTAPLVFMVASHNLESTILTIVEMEKHHVLPRAGVVHFGQLFGMQDQISYTLGNNGYSVYKYLPYGIIDEVMPYLLRRAQENSALLGGISKERDLMWQELKDRFSGILADAFEKDYGLVVDANDDMETA